MKAFITEDETIVVETDCECDNMNCEAYFRTEIDNLKRIKIESVVPDKPEYEDKEFIVLEKDTVKRLIGFINIFQGD